MPITTPVWAAFLLLFASFFSKSPTHPIRAERAQLLAGHAIAQNSKHQPSGFQLSQALPSLDIPLTGMTGPSWLRGRIVWNPELQLGMYWYPNARPLFGIHPLQFKYEFAPAGRWTLYGLTGWGGIYSNIERIETGSDGNFSLVIGGGVRYAASDRASYVAEYRHHHISNYGNDDQNNGIDSQEILFGVSFSL